VFDRLGPGRSAVKRAATSTSEDLDLEDETTGSALEYAGVLKFPTTASPEKKTKVTISMKKLVPLSKKKGTSRTALVMSGGFISVGINTALS